jgi:hypothetical protein
MYVIAAVPLGFLLMAPLGMLFDRMNWPLFHTWGLAHGSFIIAWPLLTVVVFLCALVIGRTRRLRAERESPGEETTDV